MVNIFSKKKTKKNKKKDFRNNEFIIQRNNVSDEQRAHQRVMLNDMKQYCESIGKVISSTKCSNFF